MSLQAIIKMNEKRLEKKDRTLATLACRLLEIDPESEVGTFIVNEYRPQWPADGRAGDIYQPEAVFDWLCEFTGADNDR